MKRGTASPLQFFNIISTTVIGGDPVDFVNIIVKIALVLLGLFLAYRAYVVIKGIVELCRKKKNADELRKKLDVFSVEGEVLSFTEERVSRLDTWYFVDISYSVGELTYYTDAIVFNRGSLRVGQKMILLCDNEDPSKAVLQNGNENEAVKRLIWRLAWLVVGIILDFIGTCLDWSDILGEYNRAGIRAAAVLIINMIIANLLARIKSE